MNTRVKVLLGVFPLLIGVSSAESLHSQPFYCSGSDRPASEYGWTTINETTSGLVTNATFVDKMAVGVGSAEGANDAGALDAVIPADAPTSGLGGYAYYVTRTLPEYPVEADALLYTTISTNLSVDGLGKLSLEQKCDNSDAVIRFALKVDGRWYASERDFGGNNAAWTSKTMEPFDFSEPSLWRALSVSGSDLALGSAPTSALAGAIEAYGVFVNAGSVPLAGDHLRIDNFQVHGSGGDVAPPPASNKPNVLFVVIDDLNDVPGFMGVNPDAKTPRMDALAAAGTVFKNAHCSYPLCGPSRASFLSGMLPTTMGFQGHMEYSALRARTNERGGKLIHEHFKNNGYKVFAAGKIHHKGVPEDFVDGTGGSRDFGSKEGLNYFHAKTSTDWGVPSYGGSDANFSDKLNADYAVARLGETHADPFLLMVGFVQPHVPWYTPQAYMDLYPNPNELALPRYEPSDFDDISAESEGRSLYPQYPRTADMIAQGQRGNIMQAYLACVSFTDYYLGEVLDALENSPYADNTIIVLFSDHGYHLGEKNTYQKETLWERSSHVPMLIAGPDIGVQQVAGPIVSLLDIYPTLIDLCGLSDNPMIEGRSLRPLLEDPDAEWDHPAVTSFLGNNHAVQTRQFRYIAWSQGAEELYDHFADPDEITNLAANPAYASVKEELKKHLPTNMRSTGFMTQFDVNSGTASAYVANMFATGGARLYDQPLSNTTTTVEGMRVSAITSGAKVTLEVEPASAFGAWRAATFSPRDQRDLSISGSGAEGVLENYALGVETNAIFSVETNGTPRLSFHQYSSRDDVNIEIESTNSLTNGSWTLIARSLAGATVEGLNGAVVQRTGTEPTAVEVTPAPIVLGQSSEFFKVTVEALF